MTNVFLSSSCIHTHDFNIWEMSRVVDCILDFPNYDNRITSITLVYRVDAEVLSAALQIVESIDHALGLGELKYQ